MKQIIAAAHVHSNWSYDANWPLGKISHFFGILGYNVVLLSEHDRTFTQQRLNEYRKACKRASTPRCLLMPGIEYSDQYNKVHLTTWGPIPFLGTKNRILELLHNIKRYKGVSVLAHPSRHDYLKCHKENWVNHLNGVEVWNRKNNGFSPNKFSVSIIKEYPKISPFVSLDFHCAKQAFPLSMQGKVNDRRIDEDSVVNAILGMRLEPIAFTIPISNLLRVSNLKILDLLEYFRKFATRINQLTLNL